jgi:hypothetical protein
MGSFLSDALFKSFSSKYVHNYNVIKYWLSEYTHQSLIHMVCVWGGGGGLWRLVTQQTDKLFE